MKRILSVLIAVLFIGFATNAQLTLNGVTLPAKLSFNSQTLVLNGGGVRTKLVFKLYTVGLYLSEKSTEGAAILKADKTMAIHFEITSNMINSDNMSEAINEGFDKSTGGNTTKVRTRIDELLKAFSSEEIAIGDKFDIFYNPGVGTQTYKNGKLKSTITGLDFKEALFGIWISATPISNSLKKDMLGQ